MNPDSKPTNPKDAIAIDKLPLHLWPMTATVEGSTALLEGALKYGRSNWRAVGVRASVYYDAAMRHLAAWNEGEDYAPDSGCHHLAHALACLAILVDARAAGKLRDDRMYPGGYLGLLAERTPDVARLRAKYADRQVEHFTRETALAARSHRAFCPCPTCQTDRDAIRPAVPGTAVEEPESRIPDVAKQILDEMAAESAAAPAPPSGNLHLRDAFRSGLGTHGAFCSCDKCRRDRAEAPKAAEEPMVACPDAEPNCFACQACSHRGPHRKNSRCIAGCSNAARWTGRVAGPCAPVKP